jgi:hypothetical protein
LRTQVADILDNPSTDEGAWLRVAEAIAKMENLESFRVKLDALYPPQGSADKIEMLKPLLRIRGIRVFEVKVSFDVQGTLINGIAYNGISTVVPLRPFDLEGSDGLVERSEGKAP